MFLDICLQTVKVPEDIQFPPLLVGCLGVRVNDPCGQEPGHHHCHRARQQGDGDDGVAEGGPTVPLLPIHPYRVPANPGKLRLGKIVIIDISVIIGLLQLTLKYFGDINTEEKTKDGDR